MHVAPSLLEQAKECLKEYHRGYQDGTKLAPIDGAPKHPGFYILGYQSGAFHDMEEGMSRPKE